MSETIRSGDSAAAHRLCVIDMPGLSGKLLRAIPPASRLGQWLANRHVVPLTPSFPAVTCSIQATLTTGVPPSRHGIIANGLPAFRSSQDQALVDASNFAEYRRQISFWEQSNQFLDPPRFWQNSSGASRYKTALLFFQNSMPGFAGVLRPAADIVLTPKPDHGSDGKLTSLCWSEPRDLVAKLFAEFGPFPLMNYWGPMAAIASSQWIAKASAWIWRNENPMLQWTYVPHLDYDLQRFGPASPQAIKAVVDAAEAIAPLIAAVEDSGGKILLLSEYALSDVNTVVSPNRLLSEAGLLLTRAAPDGQLINYAASAAFAMVDHQIAHVYAADAAAKKKASDVLRTAANSATTPHFDCLDPAEIGLTHRRAGDLILRAAANSWFDYRWWSDPAHAGANAPSFARTIDIHRKPGYDPLELFWDRAAGAISQDPALIRGSHGRQGIGAPDDADSSPVLVSDLPLTRAAATDVQKIVERLMA